MLWRSLSRPRSELSLWFVLCPARAGELSFTRAAERVHIDQTPLSRAVRDLEEELGVQLFVRTSRKMLLTPAGARLLEDARSMFIRLERTKRAVRQTDALY